MIDIGIPVVNVLKDAVEIVGVVSFLKPVLGAVLVAVILHVGRGAFRVFVVGPIAVAVFGTFCRLGILLRLVRLHFVFETVHELRREIIVAPEKLVQIRRISTPDLEKPFERIIAIHADNPLPDELDLILQLSQDQ